MTSVIRHLLPIRDSLPSTSTLSDVTPKAPRASPSDPTPVRRLTCCPLFASHCRRISKDFGSLFATSGQLVAIGR
jgi:hypothetical protein